MIVFIQTTHIQSHEIPRRIRIRVRKSGRRDCGPECQLRFSEGRTGYDPRDGQDVHPVVFSLRTTTSKHSVFSEGDLGTLRGVSPLQKTPTAIIDSVVGLFEFWIPQLNLCELRPCS